MKPRQRRETDEQDLFRSRLDQIISMKHELAKLAKTVSGAKNFASFVAISSGFILIKSVHTA